LISFCSLDKFIENDIIQISKAPFSDKIVLGFTISIPGYEESLVVRMEWFLRQPDKIAMSLAAVHSLAKESPARSSTCS
jgi:hypothetical protein